MIPALTSGAAKRARARTFVWGFVPGQHAFAVTREERRLVVFISELGEGALTIAIEASRTSDVETILADHAHKVLAERTSLEAAKRKGERFARAWLRGASTARCGCKDIDPKVARTGRAKKAADAR